MVKYAMSQKDAVAGPHLEIRDWRLRQLLTISRPSTFVLRLRSSKEADTDGQNLPEHAVYAHGQYAGNGTAACGLEHRAKRAAHCARPQNRPAAHNPGGNHRASW